MTNLEYQKAIKMVEGLEQIRVAVERAHGAIQFNTDAYKNVLEYLETELEYFEEQLEERKTV